MPERSTRLALTAVVAVAVLAGAAYLVTVFSGSSSSPPTTCKVGDYELDPDQASVAATMVGAVTRHRAAPPERATVLVLAAALQESNLTNVAPGDGDRDSVGVLQQRPSQGWGKVAGKPDSIAARTQRLTDVGEATREFLDALLKVPNWSTLPLAEAVQDVQISADGSAYAQHEPKAQALADALQGKKAAAISCTFQKPTKVASTAQVARQAGDELGIDTPQAAAGGTVRVPGAGWQTAAWFVANADRLGIEQVDFRGKTWTRADGWKPSKASGAAVVATMYADH